MKRTWSDKDLINAVSLANCLADVISTLGLARGGSYNSIKYHLKRLALNTDHFLSIGELQKCARSCIKVKSKEELFIENGSYNDYKKVKRIIIKENLIEYKCSICLIDNWLLKNLTLQLDHINGIKTDNRLENLRLLCPNCHSQTDNFCGKNAAKNYTKNDKGDIIKIIKENHCMVCNKKIHIKSIWCNRCRGEKQHKIIWPPISDILELTQKYGFSETGRRLGVSDNAVRKYIKRITLE